MSSWKSLKRRFQWWNPHVNSVFRLKTTNVLLRYVTDKGVPWIPEVCYSRNFAKNELKLKFMLYPSNISPNTVQNHQNIHSLTNLQNLCRIPTSRSMGSASNPCLLLGYDHNNNKNQNLICILLCILSNLSKIYNTYSS